MNSTWLDDQPVIRRCSRCGEETAAAPQVRGKIYCPSCRKLRREESLRRSNEQVRMKKKVENIGKLGTPPSMNHLSDHDLERYHLGMVKTEEELAHLEEHLLGCPSCAERAEASAQYVDLVRAAIITGNFDLE